MKSIPVVSTAGHAARGAIQYWAATSWRWRYELRAHVNGIVPLYGDDLRRALRSRISTRRAAKRPARKGDLHVFLAFGLTNWEAVLPRALSPFGRVTVFEWRSRGWNDLASDWLSQRDAMNRDMLQAFEAANAEQPVDVVVGYLSGAVVSPETLGAMTGAGAVLFNFCLDDTLWFPDVKVGGRYRSAAAIAHAVDLNLTSAPASIVKYAVHGGLATFFPEAALPELHRPVDVPFEFDVSFVGAAYGWRPRFIRQLEKHGVRVECFGRGWPNGALSDEDVVRLYSRSRANLGFGAIGQTKRLLHLKGRDFEVPMSGGLYLTQHNPELELVFDIGKEILTYRSVEDCARAIRSVLEDPARADEIRRAGRARCLRDHSYERRWANVFELAGVLEPSSAAVEAP